MWLPLWLLQVCKCQDGNDVCQVLGSCSYDICPKLTSLLAVNNDKQSCSSNAQCNTGGGTAFVCNPTQYTTYTCLNSVINTTVHPGYCEEAAPGILAAQLDDTATTIMVSAQEVYTAQRCSQKAIFTFLAHSCKHMCTCVWQAWACLGWTGNSLR